MRNTCRKALNMLGKYLQLMREKCLREMITKKKKFKLIMR